MRGISPPGPDRAIGLGILWYSKEKQCSDCGKSYTALAANSTRCPECRPAAKRRRDERSFRKQAAKRRADTAKRRSESGSAKNGAL